MALALLLTSCSSPKPALHSQYQERYVHPLVSSGTLFAQLPPAVQHTLRAETGSAEPAGVIKETHDTLTFYRISFQNPELYPPLYVAADGSVLEPDLRLAVGAPRDIFSTSTQGSVTKVSPDDLPKQVVETIHRLAPNAELDVITRESQGGKVVYVATFKDRQYRSLTIAPDGSLVH